MFLGKRESLWQAMATHALVDVCHAHYCSFFKEKFHFDTSLATRSRDAVELVGNDTNPEPRVFYWNPPSAGGTGWQEKVAGWVRPGAGLDPAGTLKTGKSKPQFSEVGIVGQHFLR